MHSTDFPAHAFDGRRPAPAASHINTGTPAVMSDGGHAQNMPAVQSFPVAQKPGEFVQNPRPAMRETDAILKLMAADIAEIIEELGDVDYLTRAPVLAKGWRDIQIDVFGPEALRRALKRGSPQAGALARSAEAFAFLAFFFIGIAAVGVGSLA